jgi:signal peptidase II
MTSRAIIYVPLVSGTFAFAIDRVTKMIAMAQKIAPSSSGLGKIIALVHHENHGIVANLPVPQLMIIGVTALVLVLVIQLLVTVSRREQAHAAAALGILIGGALGNLYDRVTMGYVFDWILLFGRSAINLADAFIVIGIAWYLWERRSVNNTP